MNTANSGKKTAATPVPPHIQRIVRKLAVLNEKLEKAGLSEKSEYRLVGPFTENPRRRMVRRGSHAPGPR